PTPSNAPLEGTYAKWAAVAQVLMLVLVAFGYWYTVLPVYQKSLLDEDIAKKTLELNKATKDLETLKITVDTEEKQLALVQSSIDKYRNESSKAKTEAFKAKLESATARTDVAIKYALLRSQSLSLFFGELLSNCTGTSVTSDQKLVDCIELTAKKSSSFLRLDEPDGKSVLARIRKSVNVNHDDWNTLTLESEKKISALSQKIDDLKKAVDVAKQNRKRTTPQERMDAIGADYEDSKSVSDLTFQLIHLKYEVPKDRQALLRKILDIPV